MHMNPLGSNVRFLYKLVQTGGWTLHSAKSDDPRVNHVGYHQGDGPYSEFEERLAVFLIQKDGGQGTCSDVGNGSCKKGTHHQSISQLQHVERQQQDWIEGGVHGVQSVEQGDSHRLYCCHGGLVSTLR